MVEYILMMVVTLTLLLGVATKLIPQLRDYMQNYAGSYVECLLETGELPPPLNSNPNSECTIESMTASGRIGTTSTGGGGGSGGGSGTNNKTSNNSNSNNGNNSNSNQNANSNGSGSGGSGSNSGPKPRVGANTGADAATPGFGSGSSSGSKGSSTGDKVAADPTLTPNELNSSGSGRGVPYSVQQDNGRGISGMIKAPNQTEAAIIGSGATSTLKKGNNFAGDDLRKSSFSAPITKDDNDNKASNDSIDLGFPFGLYLRYFLIGGLLLALILMVATQLNSLRKGWGSQ